MKSYVFKPEDLIFPILAIFIIVALVFYFMRGKESFQQGSIYDLAKKKGFTIPKSATSVSTTERFGCDVCG